MFYQWRDVIQNCGKNNQLTNDKTLYKIAVRINPVLFTKSCFDKTWKISKHILWQSALFSKVAASNPVVLLTYWKRLGCGCFSRNLWKYSEKLCFRTTSSIQYWACTIISANLCIEKTDCCETWHIGYSWL